MSQSRSLLDSLRRPEHTGDNRCLPCTVLNGVIAIALGGVASLVSVELAVATVGCCALVIYLRGYLVPYTPTLTARYLPASVLQALGKEPASRATHTVDVVERLETHREDAVDTRAFLRDTDVIQTDTGKLTAGFSTRVDAQLAALDAVDAETVATLFDADSVDTEDRAYPAYKVGVRIRKWPSEPALRTDVATHRALSEWTDRWLDVPTEQRIEILTTLRTSRSECPACGGPLTETSETVESCCVNVERYAVRCEDCQTHVREYGDPTERSGKGLTGA